VDQQLILDIVYWLEGTRNTIAGAIDHFDLDVQDDELESLLEDNQCELCKGCGWWHRSWELADDEDRPGYCPDCLE
jgi:hypothetical protein